MVNSFRKKVAIRIAMVSVVLASLASPVSWYVSLENAEKSAVSLAIEESRRLLRHHDALDLTGPKAAKHAEEAARAISGGLFDIAEIYDREGIKLAESLTKRGELVEKLLPGHVKPTYQQATYESIKLKEGYWTLRIFVPLHAVAPDESGESNTDGAITGYFEGVRVVPEWQRNQMFANSMAISLVVCLASLLCGAVVYPVVVRLSADNERKTREVLDSHISMMGALGRAIAKRDSDTGDHNYRVAWIATRLAESMGLADSRMQALIAGSFLHDVGKIGIPDAILLKHGMLDDKESTLMHSHVQQGEEIVTGMGWLEGAKAVVAGHHEKWDGSGYPHGVAGEKIPLEARIFAVADVFDALCSARPYKEAMGFDAVMAVLEKETGSHFDPAVMEAFHPLARGIFDRLAKSTEDDVRQLLEDRIRHHFQI
ncbi:Cyclic di-GMP phosphodiesterase response regulator RpfG [Gallionellaceae bacterium]|nr:Cyclic di-GMP phosphodiesterase response regulator RpfG [Gallionellaceae bacterium]